ncbi:cytidylate kinase [Desulfitispora alkaliphila]|uniref:(d)CMP kinase n=1 Tax=Desulfitispora alkaliphila TaxID=622674 RepID=UPI003D219798
MKRLEVITIDGPAGSGKSTIAKELAQELNWVHLDTGAMYRALTYKALEAKINLADHEKLTQMAKEMDITFQCSQGGQKVFCQGVDITAEIRMPEVSANVSAVAKIPSVRQELVKTQREIAQKERVILDGRDTGTCVIPEAKYKIFLTASSSERAKRRHQELESQGHYQPLAEVEAEIIKRDKIDTEREVSPLMPAEDAVIIDTSELNIKEVKAKVVSIINKGEV